MDSPECCQNGTPVAVNIASGGEPVDCEGVFIARQDGFVLKFCAGGSEFTITRAGGSTKLAAKGELSYELDLRGGKCKISAAFGDIDAELMPVADNVAADGAGVAIELAYKIAAAGAEELREVRVNARFLQR